jgi:hypothetical protein
MLLEIKNVRVLWNSVLIYDNWIVDVLCVCEIWSSYGSAGVDSRLGVIFQKTGILNGLLLI